MGKCNNELKIIDHNFNSRMEMKKVLEIFNRMFADPHGKVRYLDCFAYLVFHRYEYNWPLFQNCFSQFSQWYGCAITFGITALISFYNMLLESGALHWFYTPNRACDVCHFHFVYQRTISLQQDGYFFMKDWL